jgi:ADP-ribose pyrophosphatase YjhB (NUDIX family)
MAADCLFTDELGHLLILQPPYKRTWDLPGGVVEHDESPRAAAQREVHEELGLTVAPGPLLAVDWIPRSGDTTEIVAFLFDGGVLTPSEIDRITLEPAEAITHRFVPLPEARHLLDAEQFTRVESALEARQSAITSYLENGVPILL